jgi:anti-anti-sigma factor
VDSTFDDVASDPEDPLTIETMERDGETVLVLEGELDPHTAPQLQRQIGAVFDAGGNGLSLDLRGLTFIDSSGLRVILGAHKTANDRGGALVLRSPSPTAKRLLDITGLLDHIEVSE